MERETLLPRTPISVRLRRPALLLLLVTLLLAPFAVGARPWEGTLDPSFNPGSGVTDNEGADAAVNALALQSDGKIVIGGAFDEYRGQPRRGIARVNADGMLDTTFVVGTGLGEEGGFWIDAMAIQPDGKILIGGNFQEYNGVARPGIARLNADGSLDEAFGTETGVDGAVHAIALQPDGKILIAGSFDAYDGQPCSNVARLNADGSLDEGFDLGVDIDNYALSVAYLPSGKVLLGGSFTT